MFGKNKKSIITALAIIFCASGIFGILGLPLNYCNQKTTKLNGGFGGLRLTQKPGLSSIKHYSIQNKIVKSISYKTVEVRGIEPRRPWMISQVLDQPTPTADLLYHKIIEVKNLARGIFSVKTARAQQVYQDPIQQAILEKMYITDVKEAEKGWWEKQWDKVKSASYSAVADSLLQNFSRQFASQVANRMTTGGPGGEGFGWDVPYDDYLRNSLLTAAGDFIGSLSQVWGIDLCEPPLANGKLEMTMALINDVVRPPKPRCEWTEIARNWTKITEADYLDKFSASFDPKVNYLGGSFALRDKLKTSADAAENAAMLKRGLSTDVGFKPLTDIGGYIKTPATFISKLAWDPVDQARSNGLASQIGRYTMGDILAPALDTFLTTVAGNLIERWTTKGMFDVSVKNLALDWLKDPNSAGTTPSVGAGIGKTAADFEKGFTRPKFEPGGNRDILSELSTCPFPENPGPTSCVIDSNFAVAARTKLTVGDAIKQNYLNGNAVFGFASKDAEPKYNEGYPLRSMKILRRYRIIPVGWEIAAEYINIPSGASEYTQYSLKQMVECYSPDDEWAGTKEVWCRGLVDPDWILKSPANSCDEKAYGQEIVSEYFIEQSGAEPSKRIVSRNQFCAVDKSCVLEADNGKCLKWGYCAEEKKIWRFTGDACDEQFNTCLTLQRTTSSALGKIPPAPPLEKGGTTSYLKNTLDYGVCDASNAGCMWYCADGTWNNGAVAWECKVQAGEKSPPTPLWERGENNALFFDNGAESCDEKNEGCHKFLRLGNGANLLYNGGMENGNNWSVHTPDPSQEGNTKVSLADGAAKIETTAVGAGIYSYDSSDSAKMAKSMMPEGYSFDFSKSYILSADIKVEMGKAKIGIRNAGGTEKVEKESTKTNEWERVYVYLAKETFLPESIYIYASALDVDTNKAVFYVDNVKLEETESAPAQAPSFAAYENTNNTVYIKKAPDYLANKCTPPRFTGTSDTRPAECKKYATECKEEEAGCAKYTPINGDPWIPAILSEGDKCDPECVNYKSYKQSATNFSHEILNIDFIADNPYTPNIGGATCPAQEIGCTEFTNLDKLAKGGESREYYSELKQCIATDADGKPIQQDGSAAPQSGDNGAAGLACGTFYTWSGSDTAGYELNTYYLQKNPPDPLWKRGNPNEPGAPVQILNPQDIGKCAEPADLATNYNCREFHNEAGQKYYAIYRNTVKCSENCKPYRRTRETINESACSLYGSEWLAAGVKVTSPSGASVTVSQAVCKMEVENCLNSGGNWINNECIYKAIPGEGIKCASQNAGCNEYQGTTSGNVKTVLESYFEDGSNDGWAGGSPSSVAVIVGAQSLTVSGSGTSVVKEDVNRKLKSGNNYVVSFLAYNKTAENKTIKVVFKGTDFYAVRAIILPPSEWKDYKESIFLSGDLDENGKIEANDLAILGRAIANPMSVTSGQRELADIDGNGKIDNNDSVILSSAKDLALTSDFIEISGMSANIYLDNIVIKEIQGNIYRIKDSWTVPAVCDSPKIGAQLRCAEYTDKSNNLLQIDNFSKFCSSEAVGCEKMVDTANSESVFSSVFNAGDASKIETPRDELVYFVNDSSKYCYGGADDPGKFKGCQKFGVPQFNQEKTGLATGKEYAGDVYIINDPDSYNNIICKEEALECAEYKYTLGETQGSLYFKDPGDKICEFKNGKWVKFGGTANCPVVTDINLTIGNTPVEAPTNSWAGICPAEQSGCTEYIDPLSDNEPNEVINGGFEQDIQGLGDETKSDGPDDWLEVTGCMGVPAAGNTKCVDDLCCSEGYSKTKAIKNGTQRISTFTNDTLYTLSARAQGTGSISILGCPIESPDNSMKISGDSAILSFSNAGMSLTSGRFYLKNKDANGECLLSVNAENGFVDEVNIQKSGLYYYISSSLDKGICQNKPNTSEGCILVNEREYTPLAPLDRGELGGAHKPLTYSADVAYGDVKGANFSCAVGAAGCFLSANEIIKVEPDRVCGKWLQEGNTEIGESGEVLVRDVNACVSAKSDGSCARIVVEPMANMNFKQGNVSLMKNISGLSKAGFEWDGGNKKIDGYYPISAMSESGQYIEFSGGFEDGLAGWKAADGFSVIDNPVDAQKEDIEPRAPVGKGFAKLSGGVIGKLSEPLPVSGNLDYILSGYINSRNINTNAKSGIYVKIFNGDTLLREEKIEINQGIKKWNYLSMKFKTPLLSSKIVITIENRGAGVTGDSYSYFDEISIRPALSLNKGGMAPSLCKVYPEENSLSCEYKGDNGIRYLGTKGYCLEYDRAPGDPSVCISWYPIDIIRGEEGRDVPPITFSGFDEGPLYYCLEGQFLETRRMAEFSGRANCGIDGYCTTSWRQGHFSGPNYDRFCKPNEKAVIGSFLDWDTNLKCGTYKGSAKPQYENVINWFYYNGELSNKSPYNALPEELQIRCLKVVQVATVDGNSQVWAERLNPNSKYEITELKEKVENEQLDYSYWSQYRKDMAPYGAISISGGEPTSWDAKQGEPNAQPLDIEFLWNASLNNNKGGYSMQNNGMGLPYSCLNPSYGKCETPMGYSAVGIDKTILRGLKIDVKNNLKIAQDKLKNLFVKSYKAWEWKDSKDTVDGKAGYKTATSLKYMSKTDEIVLNKCPDSIKGAIIPPAVNEIVITWVNDKSKDAGTQCWIPWKWKEYCKDGGMICDVNNVCICNNWIKRYERDNNFVFAVASEDEYLNQYKCANEQILNVSVENILVGKDGASLRPVKEVSSENIKDTDGKCKERITTYAQKIADIREMPTTETIAKTTDEKDEDERIISNIKNAGGIWYEYTITMLSEAISFQWGQILDDKACSEYTKIVKEGSVCKQYTLKEETIGSAWEPPTTVCAGAPASHAVDESYCAVPPKVANVKINGGTGDIKIGTANDIVLSYNSIIDPNQEPLTGYFIDWGDGVEYSVEGKRKKPQPIPENPHKFGHRYYYNNTRNKCVADKYKDNICADNINNAVCLTTAGSRLCCFTNSNQCPKNLDCCYVRPSIRIKDNWGWCNNGVVPGDSSLSTDEDNRCPDNKSKWATYSNWIIVTNE